MAATLIELKLGEVMPNPFRRVEEYALDTTKIDSLRASIRDTEFWVGLTVMNHGDGHALLYGHHRLAAAIEELGPDYVHSFIDEGDVPDYIAIRKMASENSEAWSASVPHMTLSVSVARDTLDEMLDRHPTWEAALGASDFGDPQNLRDWFGSDAAGMGNGDSGAANYAQCVERGVGQHVIRKFLGGAFAKGKMVETGLRMAGPSAKQLAAAEADRIAKDAEEAEARANAEAAAKAQAEADAAHAEEAERIKAEADALLAQAEAKRKAAHEEAQRKLAQKDNFDASILPVDWNMAQCDAFQKGITSPTAMHYGGVPIGEQRKLIKLISDTYSMTGNGVDPRRKGKKKPTGPSLTAKAISQTVQEYLREGEAMFNRSKEKEIDPEVAARAVMKGRIEKARKAVDSATGAVSSLEDLILKQKADVKGNLDVIALVREFQGMERVLERLMMVIENPNKRPAKRQAGARNVTPKAKQIANG